MRTFIAILAILCMIGLTSACAKKKKKSNSSPTDPKKTEEVPKVDPADDDEEESQEVQTEQKMQDNEDDEENYEEDEEYQEPNEDSGQTPRPDNSGFAIVVNRNLANQAQLAQCLQQQISQQSPVGAQFGTFHHSIQTFTGPEEVNLQYDNNGLPQAVKRIFIRVYFNESNQFTANTADPEHGLYLNTDSKWMANGNGTYTTNALSNKAEIFRFNTMTGQNEFVFRLDLSPCRGFFK